MFRILSATSRSTQLRSQSLRCIRSIHQTSIVHARANSALAEAQVDSRTSNPQAIQPQDQSAIPPDVRTIYTPQLQTFQHATSQELKPRTRRTKKKAKQDVTEDVPSEEVKPRAIRIRKKKLPSETPAVSAEQSVEPKIPKRNLVGKSKKPKDQGHLEKPRSSPLSRPVPTPPGNPREKVVQYLQYAYGGTWRGGRSLGDTKRMNIVSEKLCDDVLERLKPSLQKHIGCDIIDINPGASIWSSKIHDILKPRTHILMEPDQDLYRPLLEPLVDAPGSTYRLVPKSGIVWGHLEKVLSKEFLPFQESLGREDPRIEQPNDSLLVIANLGYSPKKAYRGFASLTLLVIYQFMSAIKAHSLFQQYGLVRMLIWISDDEKRSILPRTIALRRKSAVEAEVACKKIEEVASSTQDVRKWRREAHLDWERLRIVLEKMEKNGIVVPDGRESVVMQDLARGNPSDIEIPSFTPEFLEEIEALEARVGSQDINKTDGSSADAKRLSALQGRKASETKQRYRMRDLCNEYDQILAIKRELDTAKDSADTRRRSEKLQTRLEGWEADVDKLSKNNQETMGGMIDNRIAFRNDPPLLLWDRREVEPLKVNADEFFPRKEMCLLDFQPRSIWPILRDKFPDNYDVFEYIAGTLFTLPSQSVQKGLIALGPGAYEWLIEECPSLTDPNKGGSRDLEKMTVRRMSQEMLKEIVEAWTRWPFKPSRYEMLSKMGSSTYDPDAMGVEDMG